MRSGALSTFSVLESQSWDFSNYSESMKRFLFLLLSLDFRVMNSNGGSHSHQRLGCHACANSISAKSNETFNMSYTARSSYLRFYFGIFFLRLFLFSVHSFHPMIWFFVKYVAYFEYLTFHQKMTAKKKTNNNKLDGWLAGWLSRVECVIKIMSWWNVICTMWQRDTAIWMCV